MDEIREIAMRIRELREVCDVSVSELAHELNIDEAVYRSYEENGKDIPISVIYHLAKKFNVDFSELVTGTSSKLDTYQVVRNGGGLLSDRYPGYVFRDLAYRFSKKIMQPFIVTLDPSDKPAELVTHSGEEFNLVLDGTVIVTFDNLELVLNKGDSIYFNPKHPHGQKCGSETPATFLTMIAE